VRGGSSPATLDELEDDQEPYTVLYSYAIWLIGRVEFDVPVDALREVMARWFFMSQITGRYTTAQKPGSRRTFPASPGSPRPTGLARASGSRHRFPPAADIFTDTDDGDVDPFAWQPWPAIEERGLGPIFSGVKRRLLR
jgi:hypothetical protein